MSLAPGEKRPCEACGTMIIGARSASNPKSVMPIVVEPHANGNVLIQQKDGELVAFVFGEPLVRQKLIDKGVVMRVSHFADCPGADQFHRR